MATFAGCKITGKTGSYTLNASATGLTGATSTSFTITIGAATQLAFTTQPGGGASGAIWSTQPAVSVVDVGGNPLNTGANSITLAIGTNPGGTLACTTNPLAAINGVASFAGCKITAVTAGTYTLSATATGLTGATSSTFTVYGAATKLVFTTEPASTAGHGTPWTTQPVVSVEDAQGDVVANSAASITLAIASQPGLFATLSCTGGNTHAATSGVASFAGCQMTGGIFSTGTYTISATSNPLTPTTSTGFQS